MTHRISIRNNSRTPSWRGAALAPLLALGLLVGCSGGGGGGGDGGSNAAPVANAGPDQLVTSGAVVALNGSATDSDGTIAGYAWTQTAGPPVTLSNPNSAAASFTAPNNPGAVLTFQLTATDNLGATGSDIVNVSIRANQPPVANAGPDQVVTGGAVVVLSGSATDSDGTIAGYAWTQTAGPPVTLSNPNTATPSFTAPSNPSALLTFRLTATDNLGATGSDTVNINVNQPPIAANGCFGAAFGVASVPGTLNALDPELGPLTYEIVTLPRYGSLSGPDADGNFTYTQSINGNNTFRRMDRFTYRAKDSTNRYSAEATAWLLVNGKVRVMPLGDSITAGIWFDNEPSSANRVGYRKKLFFDLQSVTGSAVDFIGANSGDGSSIPNFDTNHEGEPGLAAADLANSTNINYILDILNTQKPDVVLLHIGTNDLGSTAPSAVASSVNSVLSLTRNWQNGSSYPIAGYPLTVFVARIIDWVPNNPNVTTLNNAVAATVNGDATYNAIMVDHQGNPALNYVIDTIDPYTNGDMYNYLHPNPSGYDDMAARWYAELTNPANVGTKYLGLPQCP